MASRANFWPMAAVCLALAAGTGCNEGATVEGLVLDFETDAPVVEATIGFAQRQGGKIKTRDDFTAITDDDGIWVIETLNGPFPEGWFTYRHELYEPDSVHFFGADRGQTERVENFLVPLESAPPDTAAAPRR